MSTQRRYSLYHSITARLAVAFSLLCLFVLVGFYDDYRFAVDAQKIMQEVVEVNVSNESRLYQMQVDVMHYYGHVRQLPSLLDLRQVSMTEDHLEKLYASVLSDLESIRTHDMTTYNRLKPVLHNFHIDVRRLAVLMQDFAQMEAVEFYDEIIRPQADIIQNIMQERQKKYTDIRLNRYQKLKDNIALESKLILVKEGVFLILVIVLSVGIWVKTLSPLSQLTRLMRGGQAGLQVGILPFTRRRDEIGEFAQAFHALLISLNSITIEMRRQGRLMETMFEHIPLGIFLKDVRTNYTYIQINKRGLDILDNEDKDNVIGFTDYDLFPDFEADDRRKMDEATVASGELVKIEEAAIQMGDNRFIGDVMHVPIKNEGGGVIMLLSLVMDVTKRVEAQQETEMAMHAAEKAVKDAEQANRAKSEFLANMSHELRTPMNSVIGLSRLLADDGGLNPDQKEMVANIRKSGQLLIDIVNDILDISKIESGQMDLETIPFSLQDNLERVIDSLGPLASEKGVTLKLDQDQTDMPNLIGDPTRVGRILNNLVGNAVKYTFDGEVVVSIETRMRDEGMMDVECHVRDTGIGIAEDKLEHIFEKFTQADSSTTRKYGGTGLGLTITKDLVRLMGGEIGVTSTPDKGSDFFFTIPFETTNEDAVYIRQSNRLEEDVTQEENAVPVQEARVLVAEDHPLNRAFIQRQLEVMGFASVVIVEDGKKALEAMQNNEFDLVLMDCQMPEMSGYDATRAIRVEEEGGETHRIIIALTANAMEEDRKKCMEAGMDEFISKPVDADELQHVMSRWIHFETS